MADLAVQTITRPGILPTFTAATAGANADTAPGGPGRYLHVKNGSGGSITVTLDAVQLCSFGVDHNEVITVAAGAERKIALTDPRFLTAAGKVALTYSAVATITHGAFEVV